MEIIVLPKIAAMPDTISVSREALYEQVWSRPMMHLAREYGVSGNALAKTCRRLAVPVPPRGYWAKVQNGKKTSQRPSLPPVMDKHRTRATITRSSPVNPPEALRPTIIEYLQAFKAEGSPIRVAEELRRPHPCVRAPRSSATLEEPGTLPVKVSKESQGRALLILDALVKALEVRGFPVTPRGILVEGQIVQLAILEKQDRTAHIPTSAEREKRALYGGRIPLWDYLPNGLLTIYSDSYVWWRRDLRKRWSDTQTANLEGMLDDVLLGLITIGVAMRQREDERRVEADRQAELAHQQQEKERLERVAAAQKQEIITCARSFADADVVRRLIAAIQEHIQVSGLPPLPELRAWLEKAKAVAASLDPLSTGLERMLGCHEEATKAIR